MLELAKISKWAFFALAYVPLIVFMCIRFASLDPYVFLSIGLCAVFIVLILCIVNYVIDEFEDSNHQIEHFSVVESKNSEFLAFIIVYLVPFFGFTPDTRLFIALIVFFIFLGFIYIKTPLFCINPLLNLIWGYNIYEINIKKGKAVYKAFLLTKQELPLGHNARDVKRISNEVYWGEFKLPKKS
ncbi:MULTISPECIES: hypothetical protein [Methanobacterium]|uniref:Uncharacterized protein n=1 Tax=Methanobacterium veterum TaxID=408577 RepID=A0A9E5A215_9EURY|nr:MULTISPECIES: hypothetical protein [Methanobacterium]MCZ3366620.1 hypothetical protein [Methanobacterium veterum]MCZ3374236.1 hypothetical protein [Methanobacterium veterum]